MADPHPSPHPDLGGYVLGGLEPHEAAAFEDHLAGCDLCRAEVADFGRLPALLDTVAAPVHLPADLRDRTLAAVAAAARAEAVAPQASPGDRAAPARAGRQRRRAASVRWGRPLLAAAGVAIVLGVAIASWPADTPPATEFAVGTGTVTVERTRSGWRLDLDVALPRRDDGNYYEAMLVGRAGPVSVGTFNEGDDVVLWSGVPPSVYDEFVIVERPGGREVVRAQLRR